MENFAIAYKDLILRIFAWCLPTLSAGVLCVLVFRGLRYGLRALPPQARIALAGLSLVCVVLGGAKGERQRAAPRLPALLSVEDRAQGYRLDQSSAPVPMVPAPDNAVVHENWARRGAYADAVRLAAPVPLHAGGRFTPGVTVLSWGEIRPDVGTLFYPRPFPENFSLLPRARWGLLPEAGARSVFWHAATPSNSLLVTWRNAAYGRDPLAPTNFQAELFADGRFVYRYPDREDRYRPVPACDWDDDGLANEVDPEPLVANPVDAHNANAEWYRVVCSNVFTTAENQTVEQANILFRPNVCTSAYYFVDVVASAGPAAIRFQTDDDPGWLGYPAVVATPGVTNRVPLLVGVNYAVTSEVPFELAVPEAFGGVSVTTYDNRSRTVCRPMSVDFSPAGGASAYEVRINPFDLGGAFRWSWETAGPRLRSAMPGGCFLGSGSHVWAACGGDCPCGGCFAAGSYAYEGRTVTFAGGWCGCDEPGDGDGDGNGSSDGRPEPLQEPTVAFSHPGVIFEDAYANGPGEEVPRTSTETTLTVTGLGGPRGGDLVVSAIGVEKLLRTSGPELPCRIAVGRNQRMSVTFTFEGLSPSDEEDDIVVSATINGRTRTASLTSVRLTAVAEAGIPAEYKNRHRYGVCEKTTLYVQPNKIVNYNWEPSGMTVSCGDVENLNLWQFGVDNESCPFTFTYRGCQYEMPMTVVCPAGIACSAPPSPLAVTVPMGQAGGVGMSLPLELRPTNVSFKGIRIKEDIQGNGTASGYFANSYFTSWWNHTNVQGAGMSIAVGEANDFGDTATMAAECPFFWETGGWHEGSIVWPIPIKWREPSGISISRGWQNLMSTSQIFMIDAEGTTGVEKFGWRARRTTTGTTTIAPTQAVIQ